ncbi:hypothetical protein M3Y94_00262000 [Aphelenchoides besseyi]|nr:hypothetical protein M3Y94_00262000 [Aphelenchoides besseyi]KAI6236162.1 hypothetical protein M3Y95_00128400 [Aphelenchoides besseyi]
MWYSIIVLFLVCLLQVKADCPRPQYKECDPDIYACCDAEWQKAVGIASACSGKKTNEDPECVNRAIDVAFYGYGKEGVFTVCDAFSELKNCLDLSYPSCSTSPFWFENGFDKSIADTLDGFYASLNFACGAGLSSFLYNEDCMVQTYTDKFSTLNQCAVDFEEGVLKDPKNSCQYMSDYTSCWQLQFDSCSPEAGFWSCERVRTFANAFTHCELFCSAS